MSTTNFTSGAEAPVQQPVVFLAALFDFDWGPELFGATVELLNNHSDGWHDDVVFSDNAMIDYAYADTRCDGPTASQAYWDLRALAMEQITGEEPPNGIVGCRCSAASMAVAQIATLEQVPQISPASTTSQLSNKYRYPYFSRTVSPDDERGEVAALISMLDYFGWNKVGIIATDTSYATDLSTQFQDLFQGDVAYYRTVTFGNNGSSISQESIERVLESVPTDNPAANSRVILLFGHDSDVYPILKTVKETGFQPETIWIGLLAWARRIPADFTASNYPAGLLGVTPFRNRDEHYTNFLERLQAKQRREGREVWDSMPDHAAEHLVDSTVAMVKALSMVPPEYRHDGELISNTIRSLTFNGVSGPVAFTQEGDRKDPKFSLWNAQVVRTSDGTSNLQWFDVGVTGIDMGSTYLFSESHNLDDRPVCFPEVECGVVPPATYKSPSPIEVLLPKEAWIAILSVVSVLLLVAVAMFFRSRKEVNALQKNMKDLSDANDQVAAAQQHQTSLIDERSRLQAKPSNWNTASNSILNEVSPEEEEYWDFDQQLKLSIPDAYISYLWRIQNPHLHAYYSFQRERLIMHGINDNESIAWHGTSGVDPAVIYNDKQNGFMVNYSREGMWGRGLYFAETGSYSNTGYTFRPGRQGDWFSSHSDRPPAQEDEVELFQVKLLVGNAIELEPDTDLAAAPYDPERGIRYDTVSGRAADSRVWVVYENGRAYPNYLVRYYVGPWDGDRTKYKNRDEAFRKLKRLRSSSIGTEDPTNITNSTCAEVDSSALDSNSVGDTGAAVSWRFKDDDGVWTNYDDENQTKLETAYQELCSGRAGGDSKVIITANNGWTYEVDVQAKTQKNIDHDRRRKREVQRLTLPNSTGSASTR